MKNTSKTILMVCCAFIVWQTALSQITFEKRLLPVYSGGFVDILELNDHSFMGSGWGYDTTFFDGSNTLDNTIAKFDSSGNLLWLKCWGGINMEQPNAFRKVTENGNDYFLQLGVSNSFYHIPPASQLEPNDLYCIKYDGNGDTLWTRDYGPAGIYNNIMTSIDGNYIFQHAISLIKVNPVDGDTIWTRKYDLSGSQSMGFTAISNTLDSGYYLSGSALIAIAADYSLLKTDSIGNVAWCYVYGDTAANRSWAITSTLDGGAIMVGESSYNDSSDVLVIRTNSIGDTLWCKSFDYQNNKDIGKGVLLTPDNGCIINAVGTKQLPSGIVGTWYLFKLDSIGNLVWSKTNLAYVGKIMPTIDGGYISPGRVIAKMDSLGNSCTAQPITLTAKSFPLTIAPVFPTVGGGLNKCVTTNSYQSILANPFTEVDNCVWAGEQMQTVSREVISVYPNPVIDKLTVGSWQWANKEVAVTVYDVLGKRKLQCKFITSTEGKIEIDVSDLENGIYFIKLNKSVKRFVKM